MVSLELQPTPVRTSRSFDVNSASVITLYFSLPVAAQVFQAIDTQFGARHRRRTPTIRRAQGQGIPTACGPSPCWVVTAIPFNMGNRQKHGLFEKNRGRELRKTEPDCKKPRKIGHSCMLRGLVLGRPPRGGRLREVAPVGGVEAKRSRLTSGSSHSHLR